MTIENTQPDDLSSSLAYLETTYNISEEHIRLLIIFIQSVKTLDEQINPTEDLLKYLGKTKVQQIEKMNHLLDSTGQLLKAVNANLNPTKIELIKSLEGVPDEQIDNLITFIKGARKQKKSGDVEQQGSS